MTQIPDLIGYIFEEAEAVLKEAGIDYTVTETSSPRHDVEGDEIRVVRQVVKNEILNITLCRY